MNGIRKYAAAAIALALIVGLWTARGFTQSPRPTELSAFMRMKLSHSQKVLEGLAIEDYNLIAQNAQQMSLLSQDAAWRVYQTPEYLHYSADFRRLADTLTKEARAKNLDGATLAYVQMTMSCINCHKYTRGVAMASVDGPAPESLVATP